MNGFLKFVIIILILISATILPLSLWLKTDNAKEQIELFIEEILTEQLGVNAKISGISFSFPLIAKIKKISFAEQAKETVIIKDFYINILPSLFSFWEVTIWSLSAKELHILKIPTIKTKNINNDSKGLFNPNILIKEADIAKIILGKSLTNHEDDLIISLNSHLKYYSNKQQLHFAMINQLLAPDSYMLGDNSLEILGSYHIKKDKIKINSLKIQSDIAEASGNFLMDKSTNQVSGELQYKTNILGKILSKNFEGTTSNLSGNIKISGTASTPLIHTSGDILIDLPQNDYFKFYPLSWDSNLTLSDYSIDGNINLLQNGITATGKLSYKNNKLYLQNFKAITPNFKKSANLTFDTNNSILTGTISINDTTLQTSAKALPFLRSGALSLNMTYFSPDNKTQQVSTTGQIKQLYTKFGNCGLIDIDLKINDLWNFKLAPSKLALTAININDINFSHVTLNALSNNSDIQLNGSILANQPYPINLNFSSKLSPSPENFNININDLSGTLGSVPIKNSTDILFKYGKKIV